MPATLLALPVESLEERIPEIGKSLLLQRNIFDHRCIGRLGNDCRQLPMVTDEHTTRETGEQANESGFQNLRRLIDNQAVKFFHFKQILLAHHTGDGTHDYPGFCQQCQQSFAAA